MRRSAITALIAVVTTAGVAQEAVPPPPDEAIRERAQREEKLQTLERELAAGGESRSRLADEIAAIRADTARLGAALVDVGTRAHATEERIRAGETRLAELARGEAAIRRSLDGRRDLVADILAALQRIGRHPPPALMVRPGDILSAVRSAMLLGAVVPELRQEAERLAGELAERVRLRDLAMAERAALAVETADLAKTQERLNALVDLRRQRLLSREAELAGDRTRADALGREARGLRDLVERLGQDLASARREADTQRAAAEAAALEARDRFAAAAAREPVALTAKIPFGDARGRLSRPAVGMVSRSFGDLDPAGGVMRGISIVTRPRAIVTSCADARVVYAGPFRSYGRLLILNAGDGYYLLLAGMDRVGVEVGQFVLAGEPVGQMGGHESGNATSSAAPGAVEGSGPVLYVEFRKDGGPVDPGPWWAKSQGEKVRG